MFLCVFLTVCVLSRWTWPGSTGTASQTLATVTVAETASACAPPLLHTHTNAVSRGSPYTGDRPPSVVSWHTDAADTVSDYVEKHPLLSADGAFQTMLSYIVILNLTIFWPQATISSYPT